MYIDQDIILTLGSVYYYYNSVGYIVYIGWSWMMYYLWIGYWGYDYDESITYCAWIGRVVVVYSRITR